MAKKDFLKKEIKLPKLEDLFFTLSIKEKLLFARRMEVMIRSGMQILESLENLREQTQSKTMVRVLDSAISDVENGQFLYISLNKYSRIFGDFFINVIRVGETSGTIAESFRYLAEELQKQRELRSKVISAMIYPIIIFIVTLGITAVLIFLIFPKVLPIFQSLKTELPLLSRIFIGFGEAVFQYGHFFLLGLVVLVVGFMFALRSYRVRYTWHRFFLVIPFVNGMVKAVNIISIARTLALLLKSGIKIVESLDITAETVTNLVYRQAVKKTAEQVRQGETIAKNFGMKKNLFPTIFSQMIMVGENTGTLAETSLFLADFYEEELNVSSKTFTTVLEPLLLVTMGLVVSFVALAIILPIFQITQTLGR